MKTYYIIYLLGWSSLWLACQDLKPSHQNTGQLDKPDKVAWIKAKFSQALWNKRKFEVAEELFTDDFVTEDLALGQVNWEEMHGKGPESMVDHIQWWLQILPDAQLTILDAVASDDKIIETWELTGTMEGTLLGIEPNHQSIRIIGSTVVFFEGDKIKLHQTLLDKYGLMQQIGAL